MTDAALGVLPWERGVEKRRLEVWRKEEVWEERRV